jgi:hypothetical protein
LTGAVAGQAPTTFVESSYLQLRPVLLHALHLQSLLPSLSQLALTNSCHLRI